MGSRTILAPGSSIMGWALPHPQDIEDHITYGDGAGPEYDPGIVSSIGRIQGWHQSFSIRTARSPRRREQNTRHQSEQKGGPAVFSTWSMSGPSNAIWNWLPCQW